MLAGIDNENEGDEESLELFEFVGKSCWNFEAVSFSTQDFESEATRKRNIVQWTFGLNMKTWD